MEDKDLYTPLDVSMDDIRSLDRGYYTETIINFFDKLCFDLDYPSELFYSTVPNFHLTTLGAFCLVFVGVQSVDRLFDFLKKGEK